MISGTFKIFLFSEPDFEAIFLEKGALSDFDFHFFSDTMGPSFVPPVHFWRSPFSISIHFLARGAALCWIRGFSNTKIYEEGITILRERFIPNNMCLNSFMPFHINWEKNSTFQRKFLIVQEHYQGQKKPNYWRFTP